VRIAIVGAGGVGGYFGARLAAAGEDVHFVVRAGSLAALRARGLVVESAVTPVRLASVNATDDPAAAGPADVVLFTVKLPDAAGAAALVPPLVGPATVAIPLQNGVEAAEILARTVPRERVAAGVAYIASSLREPGVVVHGGPFARLRFGALAAGQRPALEAFAAACRRADIDAECVDDVRLALWEKFVFLVGLSAMTALTRQPIGAIRAEPAMRATLREVIRETCEVGRAEGVALPADFVDERMRFVDTLPATMKASMLHDLEAGRHLELDWLSGAVVRLAERHGIATPVNRTVVAGLTPWARGADAA
jgi:2-dehydropantoate 2-reductase